MVKHGLISRNLLLLEGAMSVVDDLPDYVVLNHVSRALGYSKFLFAILECLST